MCFVLGYQLVEAVDTLGEERGQHRGSPARTRQLGHVTRRRSDMHAVTVVGERLDWREHPDPVPGVSEVLVAVRTVA
jgi:hypothetical protein